MFSTKYFCIIFQSKYIVQKFLDVLLRESISQFTVGMSVQITFFIFINFIRSSNVKNNILERKNK